MWTSNNSTNIDWASYDGDGMCPGCDFCRGCGHEHRVGMNHRCGDWRKKYTQSNTAIMRDIWQPVSRQWAPRDKGWLKVHVQGEFPPVPQLSAKDERRVSLGLPPRGDWPSLKASEPYRDKPDGFGNGGDVAFETTPVAVEDYRYALRSDVVPPVLGVSAETAIDPDWDVRWDDGTVFPKK